MGRGLKDVIAALPERRRQRVGARFQQLKDEVERLGDVAAAAKTEATHRKKPARQCQRANAARAG